MEKSTSLRERINTIIWYSAQLLIFVIASFPAFFNVLWLQPQIVLIATLAWLIISLFIAAVLFRQEMSSVFIKQIWKNWFVLPFFVFAGISILWSTDWSISLMRWLTLLFIILVGGYIGLKSSIHELLKSLSIFGILILVVSLFFVFFMPYAGVMNYYSIQGAWKGIFWHKNHFGLLASFFGMLFLVNFLSSLKSKSAGKYIWAALFLLSVLCVIKSDSAAAYITTLSMTILIILVYIWLRIRYRLHKIHYLVFGLILLSILILMVVKLDFVLSIFNRKTSLTGRVPLWGYMFSAYLSKRSILGYGFNAFWYNPLHRVVLQQAAGYPDPIVISDNGFIDILINIGFLGLGLFLVFYFGSWWRAIQFAKSENSILGFLSAFLLAFILVANISWSLIFENESFFMLLMIMSLFVSSTPKTVSGKNLSLQESLP